MRQVFPLQKPLWSHHLNIRYSDREILDAAMVEMTVCVHHQFHQMIVPFTVYTSHFCYLLWTYIGPYLWFLKSEQFLQRDSDHKQFKCISKKALSFLLLIATCKKLFLSWLFNVWSSMIFSSKQTPKIAFPRGNTWRTNGECIFCAIYIVVELQGDWCKCKTRFLIILRTKITAKICLLTVLWLNLVYCVISL